MRLFRSGPRIVTLFALILVVCLAAGGPRQAFAADAAATASGSSDSAASSDSGSSSGSSSGSDGAASSGDSKSGDAAATGDESKSLADKAVEKAKKVYQAVKNGISSVIGSITGLGGSSSSGAESASSGTDAPADGASGESGGAMMSTIKDGISNLKEYTTADGENLDSFKGLVSDMKEGNVGGEDIGQSIDLVAKMKADGKEKLLHPYLSRMEKTAADADRSMKAMQGDETAKLLGSSPSDGPPAPGEDGKTSSSLSKLSIQVDAVTDGNPNIPNSTLATVVNKAEKSEDGKFQYGYEPERKSVVTTDPGGTTTKTTTYNGLVAVAKGERNGLTANFEARAGYEAGQTTVTTTPINADGFADRNTVSYSTFAGGQVNVYGKLGLNNGSIGIGVGGSAMVGITGTTTTGYDKMYKDQNLYGTSTSTTVTAAATAKGAFNASFGKETEVSAHLAIGQGLGAKLKTEVGMEKLGFTISGTWGPVTVDKNFYVNPVAVGQLVWDKKEAAYRVIEAKGPVGKAVVDAARKTETWVANTASSVQKQAGKVWNSLFGPSPPVASR